MLAKNLAIALLAIIFIGALSGGRDLGDTIRRGVRTLLLLALLIVALVFLTNSQEIVLDWLLEQLSANRIPYSPKKN